MHINPSNTPCIDQNAGLATAMGNQKLYGELLRRFLQNQSGFYEQFKSLYDAKELLLALHCAHSLKGLSGNIGAKSLEKSAAQLEYALQRHCAYEEIEIYLNQTKEILEDVLAEIYRIEENFPQTPSVHVTIDTVDIKYLWERLEDELKSYDAHASDTMEILLQQPYTQTYHDDMTLLSHAIMNYQFEEALEHLLRIKTSHTIKA